ncbi:T9SS type A sorting domain-containing protein [Mucilaginibacter antarcticus]|uniref:T9SS type A sorting domain-containing protein n=1 Tax=Mucilaginibacter antarcticus TaxID=1855725 RepID=UPI00362BB9CA
MCQIQQISGSANVCYASPQQFSLPYVAGVTYSWSITPGLQINSGQGTSSVQVAYINGSYLTGQVTCTISSSACGSATLNKAVTMGTLVSVAQVYINGTPYTGSNYAYLQRLTQYTLSVDPVAGATSYFWSLSNNMTIDYGQGTHTVHVTVGSPAGSSLSIAVQAENMCGRGAGVNVNGEITGSGGEFEGFAMYPNPTNEMLTVSYKSKEQRSAENNTKAVKKIFDIKLLNSNGKMLRLAENQTSANEVKIDTRDIAAGTYFLHIKHGKETIKKQVIIKH